MKKLKRFISLAFVLALMLSFMPAAYASNPADPGVIISKIDRDSVYENNSGIVLCNEGIIVNNLSSGIVYNMGGTVENNHGTVYNLSGTVDKNFGTVCYRLFVEGDVDVEISSTFFETDQNGQMWMKHFPSSSSIPVKISPKPGYVLGSVEGENCGLVKYDDEYRFTFSPSKGDITFHCDTFLLNPPVPASSVPATGDNSNMPLWCVGFVLLAALAILTGKKKA